MDDTNLVVTKPAVEAATQAAEHEVKHTQHQHSQQDIEAWVSAFGDCV